MGERATRHVALMAIHPRHADAILSGAKQVEFRKRRLASSIDTVLIYATAPVGGIIGDFGVAGFVQGDPDEVWCEVGPAGCVSEEEFRQYYRASPLAVAIRVGSVRKYARTVTLDELDPQPAVPQSYCYVDDAVEAQAVALGLRRVPATLFGRIRARLPGAGVGGRRRAASARA